MLSINLDDVLNVLQTVSPYLIGFAVVLVLAIIAMVGCIKLSRSTKFMVRSQAVVAIVLALIVVVNLICFGPMSTMISLATGDGSIIPLSAY